MAAPGSVGAAVDVAEEDRLRAYYYRLLARLLAAPPDTRLLNLTGHIQGDETELGAALKALAEAARAATPERSEEHTSELQSLMRISYAVLCLKKKTKSLSQIYKPAI